MLRRMKFVALALSLTAATTLAHAQTPSGGSGPAPPGARRLAASSDRREPTYIPPRTGWGDPDIQGNFTNKYEQSTPFERPQDFEGRRIEDIRPKELAKAVE